jgi:formylglycine-generating enzyme required for sulfatase activity
MSGGLVYPRKQLRLSPQDVLTHVHTIPYTCPLSFDLLRSDPRLRWPDGARPVHASDPHNRTTAMRHLAMMLSLLALTFAPQGAAEAQEASLSGEWYFDVESPNGQGQREVLFLQEDERVIGFIDSNAASGRFVGSFDGQNLSFTAVLEFGGQPMAAVYEATVEGDSMSGVIGYGLYGQATFVGYRGRRPVDATPADAELIGSAREATIEASSLGDFFGVSRRGSLAPEMIAIAGGTFVMGADNSTSNPDYEQDFAQLHAVEISAFQMSRFLVTNAQFLAFSDATGREPPLPPKGWGDYLHLYPNHPVVNVNSTDAEEYAAWLSTLDGESYRLPTEAEWEFAARAGIAGQDFLSGVEWDINGANISVWRIGRIPDRDGWKAWWDEEGETMSKSQPMTTRVGSFAPNGWGLYDMTGNVWEWMYDWYQSDYYSHSPPQDPMGPASGEEKVLRGCSWYNKPDVCFIATRDRYAPQTRLYYNDGFRVVSPGSG